MKNKQNDFERLLQKLRECPSDKVREPDRPVAIILSEAYALACVAAKYRAELERVGLDPAIIDEIEPCANTLRVAETAWTTTREKELAAVVIAAITQAYTFRSDIVSASRYALRKNDAAQATISHIQEGEGVADLCQDLVDLAAVVETHRDAFEKIDFDFAKVAHARALADEIQKGQGEVVVEKASNETRDVRNRAFTYLDDVVDEVRSAGLYAFGSDSDSTRLSLFRSNYALRRARRYRAKKAPPTVTTASSTSTPTVSPTTR